MENANELWYNIRKLRNEKSFHIKNIGVDLYHDGYTEEIIRKKDKATRNIKLSYEMLQVETQNPRWRYYYIKDLFNYTKRYDEIINEIDKLFLEFEKSKIKNYVENLTVIREFSNLMIGKLNIESLYNCYKIYPNNVDFIYINLIYFISQIKSMGYIATRLLDEYSNKNDNKYSSYLDKSGANVKNTIIKILKMTENEENIDKYLEKFEKWKLNKE